MSESETMDLAEAADYLKIHPDTLAERARAKQIPGCKVVRSWVFMRPLLREYLTCRSIVEKARPTGGSASASLAERLAGRLAQVTARKRSNSRNGKKTDSIESISSVIQGTFGGAKQQQD